jgi:hypothetical protein
MEKAKLKLEEVKFIDLYHFQMYEGKFLDLEQIDSGHEPKYIYANVSNFDTKTYEESEVRIYAHSFDDLYCAESYELTSLYNDELLCEHLKSEILNNRKEIYDTKIDAITYSDWFGSDIYISPNKNVYCLYPFSDVKYLIMDTDMVLDELMNIDNFERDTREVLVYWMYTDDCEKDEFIQSIKSIVAEYEENPEKFLKKYNSKGRNLIKS